MLGEFGIVAKREIRQIARRSRRRRHRQRHRGAGVEGFGERGFVDGVMSRQPHILVRKRQIVAHIAAGSRG